MINSIKKGLRNLAPICSGLCALLFIVGCATQPASAPSGATPADRGAPGTAAPASGTSTTLNVFAAASLTGAFGEIGQAFEAAHPGVRVVFNFAGSQQLVQQLAQGAPADVFASANQNQIDAAIEAGSILTGTQQVFVKNRLVVIVPKENPAGITALQDLTKESLRLVLAAKEVPAGQYSLDFLDKAALEPEFGATYKDNVLANVVSYEDNVKAVLSKVALGEADAGVIYSSDLSGDNADQVMQIEIPDSLNVIAAYPIASVVGSPNLRLAAAFIETVLSAEGQAVLAKYGFIPIYR